MEDKTVLIIGASGGIGQKVAETLLANGYSVIGTYHNNESKIKSLSDQKNFTALHFDISNPLNTEELFNKLKDTNIYAVINCAGVVKFEGEDTKSDFEIWDNTIAINLSSNFYLAKIIYPLLSENGRFIMISSTDAMYGGAITASYAASKAGVNSLTKSLSLLFKEKKIRVNSVAPGWVSTPMIEGNSKDFYKQLAETNPLRKIADPEDIAKVINFLLSENSNYINGQVITVDGGYTNQDPTLLLEETEK